MSDAQPPDQPGALRKAAVNAFYGYGYTFYRQENELRADDQRTRRLAGELLRRARQAVSAAEATWRRETIPPPSRAQPSPDPAAVAGAQALERLAREIAALDAAIQAQPVPADDRMMRRYREEAATLAALGEKDIELAEAAQAILAACEDRAADALVGEVAAVEVLVGVARSRLAERAMLLA